MTDRSAASGPLPPGAARPRLRLRVTSTAETLLRRGHPWLYAASVREQNRPGEVGELAVVYDRQDRFLAVGLYDPASPIALRVLHAGKPATIDGPWWAAHLERAASQRDGLFPADDPGGLTDGYRLVNGESDGWPGLVLDRYAGTLVLKLYTAAWFPHLGAVLGAVRARFPASAVVLRLSRNIMAAAAGHGLSDGQVLAGELDGEAVHFREHGLTFEAEVRRGQKTGFFLDQRENRRRVERLSRGRRVLNAFSFSGGFSLYAARGGASEVTSLDISAHALASSERNFALNPDLDASRHRPLQADVFEWLEREVQETGDFDLIVLDPPSLARRERERGGAVQAYGRLAAGAIRRLTPGGVLLSASCSAHVSADEFFGAVRAAARASGRPFRELETTAHAPDHHASFAEAQYLKAIYLQF